MAVRLKSMTAREMGELGPEVIQSFSNDTFQSIGVDLAGSDYYHDSGNSASSDHNRAVIALTRPVVNTVLARKNAALLAKILGIKQKLATDIYNCNVVYVKSKDTFVPRERLTAMGISKYDILVGAQVFQKLINDFAIEDSLKEELMFLIHTVDKNSEGEINRKSGISLIDGWKYKSKVPVDEESVKEAIVDELSGGDSRLAYLLRMGDKRNLENTIMSSVVVLPLTLRPDIENRHDPLSHLYSNIVKANKDLPLRWEAKNAEGFVVAYRNLQFAVASLLTGSESKYNSKVKKKSLIERVGSKQGIVRNKILGKRIDYSGRSVITIDPFLSMTKIKVPVMFASKLYQQHLLSRFNSNRTLEILTKPPKGDILDMLKDIMKQVPIITGRQPTLHKLSMQAYDGELTEGNSIRLNPLMCPAFNADFDGDQMYDFVPNNSDSIMEARLLMKTIENPYLPENGELVVCPRQEIVYGLWICTKEYPQGNFVGDYPTNESVMEAVIGQKIKVSDRVTVEGKLEETAGVKAFRSCFSPFYLEEVVPVTSKTIKKYVKSVINVNTDIYVKTIDRLVALGFKVGYICPPPLILLNKNFDPNLFDPFHQTIDEITAWYERGYEEEETYNIEYTKAYNAVNKIAMGKIYDDLGDDNGFVQMAKCGARGSEANLTQIFSHKGRIQKSDLENFNAVIEHSYVEQLNPLEHFMTACGSRRDIMAKSLSSADTGYLTRQLVNVSETVRIVAEDCGTKDGILINKEYLQQFTDSPKSAEEMFIKAVTGRYTTDNKYITVEMAKSVADSGNASLRIRSPLTCKNPCCRRCYGDDPASHKPSVVGTEVGIIAGQSIGKIATQLSMDSFKKGGVGGKQDVLSNFKKVDDYLHMRSFKDMASYDPIAWATGKVISRPNIGGMQKVYIEGSRHPITISDTAILKPYVTKGEGLCLAGGEFSPDEIAKYWEVTDAQRYLSLALFSTYYGETEVSLKHFEVLVLSMTLGIVLETDRTDIKPGCLYDMSKMCSGSLSNTKYEKRIYGVLKAPLIKATALSSLLMGYINEGLSRAVMMQETDDMECLSNRCLMGKGTKGGTNNEQFIISKKN